MKTFVIRPALPLLICAFILLGCGSTNNLTMSVTEPAPVYVPNHIKQIGVLNRSETTSNKTLDKIDKVFSAEGQNLDKEGAENLILGIKDEFEKNQTFEDVIRILEEKGEVEKGDYIINCASMPIHLKRRTNAIKVSVVE